MASNNSGGSFIIGFLVCGIVGTAVGVLLAPRPGMETRAELAERSEAWRTRAEELAATLRERIGPTVESMREKVAPAVESVRERVEPVVEQVSARVGRSPRAPSTDEAEPAEAEGEGDKPAEEQKA